MFGSAPLQFRCHFYFAVAAAWRTGTGKRSISLQSFAVRQPSNIVLKCANLVGPEGLSDNQKTLNLEVGTVINLG